MKLLTIILVISAALISSIAIFVTVESRAGPSNHLREAGPSWDRVNINRGKCTVTSMSMAGDENLCDVVNDMMKSRSQAEAEESLNRLPKRVVITEDSGHRFTPTGDPSDKVQRMIPVITLKPFRCAIFDKDSNIINTPCPSLPY